MADTPQNPGTKLGGDAGDALGALIGEALAAGDYARAEQLRQQQMDLYKGIAQPQDFTRQGASAFDSIQMDPRLKAARMAALQRMQQIGLEGGMDVESRAANQEAQDQAAGFARGQQGALMQSMQSRGMGGSGMEAAAALQGQQAGSNMLAKSGMQAAADARKRALAALSGSADMAGDLSRDEYGMAADKAHAGDAISRFNAENANQFQQQKFGNAMDVAGAESGVYGNEMQDAEERAARKKALARGIGRIGGAVAGTVAAS
jgi:hypothetical protein